MSILIHRLTVAAVFLLFVSLGLMGGRRAIAGEAVWIIGEGTAPVSRPKIAQEKDRMHALKAAEQDALYKAVAADISLKTLLASMDILGGILNAIPYGKIVEKKILKEGPVASDGINDKLYRSRIKARVMKQTGRKDQSFYLEAKLNKFDFNDKDELEIHIRPSKACYFAVFNILEDDKIIPLLPTAPFEQNHLLAKEKVVIPGNKGRKLRVHLPEGKKTITEYIFVMALLHPFTPVVNNTPMETHLTAGGQRELMRNLVQSTVAVPLEERAEALIDYEVRRSGK